MYGVKQFLHVEPEKLKSTLKKFRFTRLQSCECVFKFKDEKHEIVIFVYRDDLVILSPELSGVKWKK